MTGLDCLREEMKKRGLGMQQIESKTAAVVLDILANSGTKYTEIWTEEYEKSERLRSIERDIRDYVEPEPYKEEVKYDER